MSYIFEDYAEVSVEIAIPGDAGPAYVVFGVWPNIAGVPTSIGTTADNVGDTLNNTPGFRDMMTSDAEVQGYTVRQRTGLATVAIETRTEIFSGTLNTPSATPQVSVLLQKNTGLAGRPNRGRMYVPMVSEAGVNSDGYLTTTTKNNIQTAATAFLDDLGTNNVPMVILHNDPADTPTVVTSLICAPKVATQRRRLR